MTDLEKAARMALEALGYYEVAGLATTRVAKSITALRQALSNSVEQPAKQRHIAYVCPQCHWTLEEQPAQQEPTGYTTGINWQPRQSEMVVKIVRNKQLEHGFVHAIYTSSQPAQQEHKPWCASLSALMFKPRPCDCKRVPLPTAPGSAARSADSAEPFCKPWVGLNAKDLTEIPPSCFEGAIWADAKLKEKNT